MLQYFFRQLPKIWQLMPVIIKSTSLQMAHPRECIQHVYSSECNHIGAKHFPDFYLLQLVFSFIHFTHKFLDFLCSWFWFLFFILSCTFHQYVAAFPPHAAKPFAPTTSLWTQVLRTVCAMQWFLTFLRTRTPELSQKFLDPWAFTKTPLSFHKKLEPLFYALEPLSFHKNFWTLVWTVFKQCLTLTYCHCSKYTKYTNNQT